MDTRLLLLGGAALVLSGCNQTGNTTANNEAANAVAAAAPKRPSYCFFKDSDTKGWSASRDAQGNVTVKGKGHLEDTAYMAQLGEPEVAGTSAKLWLTMGTNTGPTGALENWWDVKAVIPNSGAIDTVTVLCGTKTVAQLKVPAGR
jgi:hypothetical protein